MGTSVINDLVGFYLRISYSYEYRATYALLKPFQCWNLPSGPNTGDDFKKYSAFPEENKQFCRYFVLIWMKQRLIWFNLQTDGTRNWLPNIKETCTENLHLKMLALCTKVWAFSKAGLSSLYDGKINVKKKYLMCQIPIKILKHMQLQTQVYIT